MSKLELHKSFTAFSKLYFSKKTPLSASGGDNKNCPVTPPVGAVCGSSLSVL
jgi:hypothetical protein